MKTIIKYGLALLLSLLSPGLSAKPKQPLLLPDSTGRGGLFGIRAVFYPLLISCWASSTFPSSSSWT